jgi:hypothetical protein
VATISGSYKILTLTAVSTTTALNQGKSSQRSNIYYTMCRKKVSIYNDSESEKFGIPVSMGTLEQNSTLF